ncbi:energy transducer TonB [Bradyrhizobium cenepequi]|uniref:energy transducer TonB n=1 Tax=Bradyrhizobium cenepequi TaxID=2821403 RepID=UPI001CE3A3A5|nr:energy transducer TonB [Bradyrhizobium cenepequi]MCA6107870.1 energy transducer TonB [Bradyrhizobium cenepequi]
MAIKNTLLGDGEALPETSNPVVQFVLPSVLAVMLLAGGIYWIRQLPASLAPSGTRGTIQVRLVRTPAIAPLPVRATDQPIASNPGVQSDLQGQSKQQAENRPPTLPADAMASIERPARPTVSAPQSSVSSPPNSAAVRFQQVLMRHIERFQRYPGVARRARLEGTVKVAFVMDRDGKIVNAWVRSSSGQSALDKEAVEALRRAEPLPSIPGELPGRLSVLLPVSFAAN